MILTIKRDRFRFSSCSDRRSKIHPSPRSSSPITQRRLIAQNSSDSIRPLHQESISKRGNMKNETDRGDQETDTRETLQHIHVKVISQLAGRTNGWPRSNTEGNFEFSPSKRRRRTVSECESKSERERVCKRERKREKRKRENGERLRVKARGMRNTRRKMPERISCISYTYKHTRYVYIHAYVYT